MLDENNLSTYEVSEAWYSVQHARETKRIMARAIQQQILRAETALFPMSAQTDIHITFGEEA
jgi:hypothetical protein